MKQALAIVTHPANRAAMNLLMASIPWTLRWPVVIVVNEAPKAPLDWRLRLCEYGTVLEEPTNGYELGAIRAILRDTDLDEFLLLQDSYELLDVSFLDDVFAYRGSVSLGVAGAHYGLKYRRVTLEKLEPLPTASSKAESVHWEHAFARMYFAVEDEPVWTFDPHFHDAEHAGFDEAFGRTNMILRNDFFLKRKADWGQRSLAGR